MDNSVIVIVVIGIVICIVAMCREITCWYFKFNEMLSVMTEIRNLLKEISQSRRAQ
jgi:hypothetical protein